ncbi:MAG: hypothetical protein IPK78_03920 [Rhodospirillales bacterium]|nr:hypothetical protein [Rhodospirillales bacterium]
MVTRDDLLHVIVRALMDSRYVQPRRRRNALARGVRRGPCAGETLRGRYRRRPRGCRFAVDGAAAVPGADDAGTEVRRVTASPSSPPLLPGRRPRLRMIGAARPAASRSR